MFVAGGFEDKQAPEGDARVHPLRGAPPKPTWPLQIPRYLHSSIAITPSQILLSGGLTTRDDNLVATPEVERIDLETGTSERLASLPFHTAEPTAVLLPDGQILIAGGYDEEILRDTAILSSLSGEWRSASKLPSPRAGATPLLVQGHLLLLGGVEAIGAPPATSILTQDLATGTWAEIPFEIPSSAAIAPLEDGTFLIAGGRSKEGAPIAEVTHFTATLLP